MTSDGKDGESFRLLFVCTGNTCRSPMAEAIARRAIQERGWDHVEVASAGTSAAPGASASAGALRAASKGGLDLSAHRSRSLSDDLADWADLILVMSPGHLVRIAHLDAGGRATLLTAFADGQESSDAGDWGVPDPFGGDDETYERTFEALTELIDRSLERLAPILSP